jgi:hypothetical protein
LLQVLQPELLVGLDARVTGVVILAGGTSTDASFRRAARLRNAQSAARQELASPYATAALLSLTGVGAVALNSWGSTVASSTSLLHGLMTTQSGTATDHPRSRSAAKKTASSTTAEASTTGDIPTLPAEEVGAFLASSQYVSVARAVRATLDLPVQVQLGDEVVLAVAKPRVRFNGTVYGLPTVSLV